MRRSSRPSISPRLSAPRSGWLRTSSIEGSSCSHQKASAPPTPYRQTMAQRGLRSGETDSVRGHGNSGALRHVARCGAGQPLEWGGVAGSGVGGGENRGPCAALLRLLRRSARRQVTRRALGAAAAGGAVRFNSLRVRRRRDCPCKTRGLRVEQRFGQTAPGPPGGTATRAIRPDARREVRDHATRPGQQRHDERDCRGLQTAGRISHIARIWRSASPLHQRLQRFPTSCTP